QVAHPPDVVPHPVLVAVLPNHFFTGNLLTDLDRLQHGTVRCPPAAHVVDLTLARVAKELVEGLDQVGAMDVVPHLFAPVAEDGVPSSLDATLQQVSEKSVEWRSGMIRAGQTAAAKARRLHPKIASVLLDHHIGGNLRSTEDAVHRMIDAHVFANAGRVGMGWVDLPSRLQLDQ